MTAARKSPGKGVTSFPQAQDSKSSTGVELSQNVPSTNNMEFSAVLQMDFFAVLSDQPEPPTLDALLSPDQIYESDDVELFSRLTEDERFDRKSFKANPRDLGPIFSAFSNGPNTRGGVVAFGFDNSTRRLEGCLNLSENRLQSILAAAMIYCPSARVVHRKVGASRVDGTADFLFCFAFSICQIAL